MFRETPECAREGGINCDGNIVRRVTVQTFTEVLTKNSLKGLHLKSNRLKHSTFPAAVPTQYIVVP